MKTESVDDLAYELEQAKEQELAAHNRRLVAEGKLLAVLGCQDEGTTKHQTDWYIVRTEGNVTRTLVSDYGARLEGLDPSIQNAVIRYKPSIDLRALKALATDDPDSYRIMCKAIETKPAKPTVKVERRDVVDVEEAA